MKQLFFVVCLLGMYSVATGQDFPPPEPVSGECYVQVFFECDQIYVGGSCPSDNECSPVGNGFFACQRSYGTEIIGPLLVSHVSDLHPDGSSGYSSWQEISVFCGVMWHCQCDAQTSCHNVGLNWTPSQLIAESFEPVGPPFQTCITGGLGM